MCDMILPPGVPKSRMLWVLMIIHFFPYFAIISTSQHITWRGEEKHGGDESRIVPYYGHNSVRALFGDGRVRVAGSFRVQYSSV